MDEQRIVSTVPNQCKQQELVMKEIQKIISTYVSNAENESKEKYTAKEKLIQDDKDMNTQQKLEALDKNYDCRNQERWQNVKTSAVVSFTVLVIAIGSPYAVKSMRKLIVT